MFNSFTPFQVSGRLTELKTTIDAGLGHRNILLHAIGDKFELWNLKVLFCWVACVDPSVLNHSSLCLPIAGAQRESYLSYFEHA